MSVLDATASAALSGDVIKPVFFVWLDILGDPVRANTSGANITITGSGDPELDGFEFLGIGSDVVDVSAVSFATGGSEPVTMKLSGIAGVDNDLLSVIADPANWRGRVARLWRMIRNADNVQQGGFHAYYTGRIAQLSHSSENGGQIVTCTVESYLAALSAASNRTYLDQERYDAGDLSARATIAVANGNTKATSPIVNAGIGLGSGGSDAVNFFVRNR